MLEIEAKYYLGDEAAARQVAQRCGFEWRDGQFEVNRIFDYPDQSLRRREAVVRLRTRGDSAWLTYKENAEGERQHAKVRHEYETGIADAEGATDVLRGLGLTEVLRYERFRAHYPIEGACMVLDRVPGGWFCEIEGDFDHIEALARRAALPPERALSLPYPTIFVKLLQYNDIECRAWDFGLVEGGRFRIPAPDDPWWAQLLKTP